MNEIALSAQQCQHRRRALDQQTFHLVGVMSAAILEPAARGSRQAILLALALPCPALRSFSPMTINDHASAVLLFGSQPAHLIAIITPSDDSGPSRVLLFCALARNNTVMWQENVAADLGSRAALIVTATTSCVMGNALWHLPCLSVFIPASRAASTDNPIKVHDLLPIEKGKVNASFGRLLVVQWV